jgi:serine/threonine protein kinase
VSNDPLIGRQLANYHIERLIGRGGMASVYYATDIRLNRPAAVKVIDPEFRDKEFFTTRFIQEARSVATWRHDHIIQVYHAGEEGGLFYFAMEYIDGMTLEQILSTYKVQGKHLPVPDVFRYGRAIASALDYAHKKGVVHRDVKPLNVLVASDGRVVLTDFGIALDTVQGSIGEAFGTPDYIAPEQARRSNAAVPQSDLYSLGVILYEMLTGSLPFDDPSPTSVALQHIMMPPPSPRQINPALSEETETVLLRALSKDPSDRYPTGLALIEALEKALHNSLSQDSTYPSQLPLLTMPSLAGDPVSPRPTSLQHTDAYRSAGFLPWLALIIAVLLLTGTAVTIALSLHQGLSTKQTLPTSPITSVTNMPTGVLSLAEPSTTNPANPSLTPGENLSTQPFKTPLPVLVPSNGSSDQPTPTLKYTDRRGFKLYYNDSSFYMHQFSGVGDLIASVTFERLDANDRLLNSFSGNLWAQFSQSSMRDWCYRVDIIDAVDYLSPPECGERFLASIHLSPGNSSIFWTSQEGSQVFRILWRDEELVRCEIAAGSCEVFLP